MKLIIQKLSVLTLVLTVLFTTALPAQAELSSENKETLKEIMANNPNDLLAIMTYLYSLMYQGTSLPGTTTGTKTTETPSTTTTETPQNNAQLCTYAKGITKNLSRGMNDPQVKTLQKFLNALAVQDTNYNAVIASGDGSYGNETTYFGSGTQNAVKVLQGRLKVLQSGMVGPLTRAAMVKKVCGTSSLSETEAAKNTLTPPRRGSQATTVDSSQLPTYTPTGTDSYTKPTLSFEKTSAKKGETVSYSYDKNGLVGCRLAQRFLNQDTTSTNTWLPDKDSGESAHFMQVSTEFYVTCNGVAQGNIKTHDYGGSVESERVTVVVDGVTENGGQGSGNASINISNPTYTKFNGGSNLDKIHFYADYNAAADDVVLYYGTTESGCTDLGTKLTGTGTLSSGKTFTLGASSLNPTTAYYYCAAAIKSDGSTVVQSSVKSFIVTDLKEKAY